MRKPNFLLTSIVVHVALLALLLLLPPPFPAAKLHGLKELIYVQISDYIGGSAASENDKGEEKKKKDGPAGNKKERKNGTEKASELNTASSPSIKPKFSRQPSPRQMPEASSGQVMPPAQPVSQTDSQTVSQAGPVQAAQPPSQAQPSVPANPGQPQPQPAAQAPQPKTDRPAVAVYAPSPRQVSADRNEINFRYQSGWPAPSMVRLGLDMKDGKGKKADWRAEASEGWLMVSPSSGKAPGRVKVGIMASKLSPGYYTGRVRIIPSAPDVAGDTVSVSVMVMPKSKGIVELPHSAWDSYMDGECKVCHLPENLMPQGRFMFQPEFCLLCHNPSGMGKDSIPGQGGHPMLIEAGSGGTKVPTHGTVASGEKSDRMDTHLKGRAIVCVTCHNVMTKPGDFGRAWELASSDDRRTYMLYKGGWDGLGCMRPKVYVTDRMIAMPKALKEAGKYLVKPSEYDFDEAEGSITFHALRGKFEFVYVTLSEPYLRVSTRGNSMCYDCHFENTHEGLSCLACHVVHGTDNIKGIARYVRTADTGDRKVVFRATKGKGSFADGGKVRDGICEGCHTMTKCHRAAGGPDRHANGKDYSGTDCTRCHTHKNGFGI
jgi:hypothetical protein